MRTYVVAAAASHTALLGRILQFAGLPDTRVLSRGGRMEAISLARSILSARAEPVAVVLDACTLDSGYLAEQELEYHELLHIASPGIPFQLFLGVPELEAILFGSPGTLARLLGTPVPADAVREAEYRPRAVLERLTAESDSGGDLYSLIERIDKQAACAVAKHPLIRSLIQFLRHPRAWVPDAAAA